MVGRRCRNRAGNQSAESQQEETHDEELDLLEKSIGPGWREQQLYKPSPLPDLPTDQSPSASFFLIEEGDWDSVMT